MDLGYRESSEKEKADIVVINTCSIREHADERFFGILGQLKKLKENNQDMIVALCGCMMQQQHIIERVKTKFPWVDVIFGTHNIHEFPKLIKALIDEKQRQIHVWDEGGDIVEGLPSKRKFKYKSFVNIMQGCNNSAKEGMTTVPPLLTVFSTISIKASMLLPLFGSSKIGRASCRERV